MRSLKTKRSTQALEERKMNHLFVTSTTYGPFVHQTIDLSLNHWWRQSTLFDYKIHRRRIDYDLLESVTGHNIIYTYFYHSNTMFSVYDNGKQLITYGLDGGNWIQKKARYCFGHQTCLSIIQKIYRQNNNQAIKRYQNSQLMDSSKPYRVDGCKKWYNNGYLHREDGPAVIDLSTDDKFYYQFIRGESKLHRKGGPAVILACGDKQWWENGKLIKTEGRRMQNTYWNH